MNMLYNLNIIHNVNMVITTQKRKHHKKRINKKWLKKYGYNSKPNPDVFLTNNSIIGHPETIRKLQQLINKKGGVNDSDKESKWITKNTSQMIGIPNNFIMNTF